MKVLLIAVLLASLASNAYVLVGSHKPAPVRASCCGCVDCRCIDCPAECCGAKAAK